MKLVVIILAGGKGTRIKSILLDTPKVLAPISNKVFLDWIILWINSWELSLKPEVIISTGHGHDKVHEYSQKIRYQHIRTIRESRSLGTFGAAAFVAAKTKADHYLILNGDTIFSIDMQEAFLQYQKFNYEPLLILKRSSNCDRYGGYSQLGKKWFPTTYNCQAISLGACFTSYNDLKERWNALCPNILFSASTIESNIDRELMMDSDFIGLKPINGYLLPESNMFIDIGIPISLKKAQKTIPKILSI